MTQDLDIELSRIDINSDNYQSETLAVLNRWHEDDEQRRTERAAAWSQSINFLLGNQWIQFNERTRHYETIPYTDANKNIDRPVTNHLLRWVITNLAGFTAEPTTTVDPNSDEPSDKTSAKVAEVILDYLWDEMGKGQQYYEAALWAICCGITFRKSFKKNTFNYLELPQMEGGKQKLDEDGNPVSTKQRIRCPESEIISPFNLSFDGIPKRWKDVNIVMESSVRRLGFIKENYDADLPGYLGNAAKVKEESVVTHVLGIGEGLRNLVEGQRTSNFTKGFNEVKGSAIVKEVYVRPTLQHPMGRMLVSAGEHLLFDSAKGDKKSPYFYQDGKIWHPYTCWNFWLLPGSMWGMSMVQQLVPIQRRINAIDALMAYNRKTVAVSQWLIPSGANIPDESIIGTPGQHITYDVDAHGAKPEKTHGEPLPQQVLNERALLLEEGSQIANAADIRSGENPRGVNTVGQLQILTEQADKQRSKQIESWEQFIEDSESLDLLNFQDCYVAPDEKMVAKFKKYSKDLTKYDWDHFLGEKIRDNSNVKVEPNSTVPKSRIMRQNIILKLAGMGLLGEIVGDPYAHKKFLEEFGLTELFSDGSIDMQKAEKCIEMMLDGQYPPVLEGVDNPDVQLIVLARYMKQPKFLELDPKIKNLFFKRHQEYVQELAKSNPVPANAPEGAGAPQPGGGAGEPVMQDSMAA